MLSFLMQKVPKLNLNLANPLSKIRLNGIVIFSSKLKISQSCNTHP